MVPELHLLRFAQPSVAEFIDFGAIDFPESFAAAMERMKKNVRYFFVNYAIIISVCVALSLIGLPLSLIVVAVVFVSWSLLCFFIEDPLPVFGRVISDRSALVDLVVVSVVVA